MLKIALVSDFFFPSIGGVEQHIYYLSYCLRSQGHKVIILTRSRHEQDFIGIRHITKQIKVYYLPVYNIGTISFHPLSNTLDLLIRNIFIYEDIQIVHGHQGSSTLSISTKFVARAQNLPFVHTEHSIFDLHDTVQILLNQVYKAFSLLTLSKVICVSNTVRENFILRTHIDSKKTVVIPNAIDTIFYNKKEVEESLRKKEGKVRIVVLTRMTWRKGMDLLMEIFPVICRKYDFVEFLICGDGPKKTLIQAIVEEYQLQNQVILIGFTTSKKVTEILSSGDIFLNTSVSEAFCIAILEAASCGLYVCSTNVGGISEILPKDFITLAKAKSENMIESLCNIIDNKLYLQKKNYNQFIKEYYNWHRVAKQTVQVYQDVLKNYQKQTLIGDFFMLLTKLPQFIWLILIIGVVKLMMVIYDFFDPPEQREKAVDLPIDQLISNQLFLFFKINTSNQNLY